RGRDQLVSPEHACRYDATDTTGHSSTGCCSSHVTPVRLSCWGPIKFPKHRRAKGSSINRKIIANKFHKHSRCPEKGSIEQQRCKGEECHDARRRLYRQPAGRD